MADRSTVIRDPVHGDVYLTGEELRLIDTPEMQRLRGIRQLGTAHLVYPGAQHTRFEHSLGTMHVLTRLVAAVNLNQTLDPARLARIAPEQERTLRAAALVHDIAHIPFGHNIEDQTAQLPRHDSPSRLRAALAPTTGVGGVLDDMGIRKQVIASLVPPDTADEPLSTPPYARELLSDTICADTLDYLKRDAYYTGLNLLYDERVIRTFKVDAASGHLYVDASKRGLVREDVLSELIRVLEARYFFSERVYYHHAKIAAGAMIAHAVESSLHEGGLEPSDLYGQTDDSLSGLLARHPPAGAEEARAQAALLADYARRRLLKRACVFPLYANRAAQDELIERFFAPGRYASRRQLEREVQAELSRTLAAPPTVVLYCPAREMQLTEVQTRVRFPGQGIRAMSQLEDQVARLGHLEQAYRDLWKLYVLAGTDDAATLVRIGEIVARLLPMATNVYAPPR